MSELNKKALEVGRRLERKATSGPWSNGWAQPSGMAKNSRVQIKPVLTAEDSALLLFLRNNAVDFLDAAEKLTAATAKLEAIEKLTWQGASTWKDVLEIIHPK